MFALRLAPLLLSLTLATVATPSGAEGALHVDEPTQESPATTVWARHGIFTSLSASMGLMSLDRDDGAYSHSGIGAGVQARAGYGVGLLSLFVDFNYATSMSTSEEGIGRLRMEDFSFDFMAVGAGLALVTDVGYVSASWLFDATAKGTGKVIKGDRYELDASGHGARLDAVALLRSPSGWGAGLGPYFQWLSLTSDDKDKSSLTGYSYGLTLNASFY